MNREPSVFPVAPATVFPADSKPGVPDGLCDQRGAPMSTSAQPTRPDSEVVVTGVSEVAHLFKAADWARILDAYVSYTRQVEWITEEVRVREGWYDREPQPGDGPEYHADHAAWVERQETRLHRCSDPECLDCA